MTSYCTDLPGATWRKSSHSSGNGGQCVEATTVWRKSNCSGGNGGECVAAAALWRKSSHSGGNGGDCVEVAPDRGRLVAVRDSKDPNGPKLLLSAARWQTFTARIKAADGF
jgi:hypothetical protein